MLEKKTLVISEAKHHCSTATRSILLMKINVRLVFAIANVEHAVKTISKENTEKRAPGPGGSVASSAVTKTVPRKMVRVVQRGKVELTWAHLNRVYRGRSETGRDEHQRWVWQRRGTFARKRREKSIVFRRHLQLSEQVRGQLFSTLH